MMITSEWWLLMIPDLVTTNDLKSLVILGNDPAVNRLSVMIYHHPTMVPSCCDFPWWLPVSVVSCVFFHHLDPPITGLAGKSINTLETWLCWLQIIGLSTMVSQVDFPIIPGNWCFLVRCFGRLSPVRRRQVRLQLRQPWIRGSDLRGPPGLTIASRTTSTFRKGSFLCKCLKFLWTHDYKHLNSLQLFFLFPRLFFWFLFLDCPLGFPEMDYWTGSWVPKFGCTTKCPSREMHPLHTGLSIQMPGLLMFSPAVRKRLWPCAGFFGKGRTHQSSAAGGMLLRNPLNLKRSTCFFHFHLTREHSKMPFLGYFGLMLFDICHSFCGGQTTSELATMVGVLL